MSTSIQDVEKIRQLEARMDNLEKQLQSLQHVIHAAASSQSRLNGNVPTTETGKAIEKLWAEVKGIKMRMGKREQLSGG